MDRIAQPQEFSKDKITALEKFKNYHQSFIIIKLIIEIEEESKKHKKSKLKKEDQGKNKVSHLDLIVEVEKVIAPQDLDLSQHHQEQKENKI